MAEILRTSITQIRAEICVAEVTLACALVPHETPRNSRQAVGAQVTGDNLHRA